MDYDPNPSELAAASSVGNVGGDSSDEDIEGDENNITDLMGLDLQSRQWTTDSEAPPHKRELKCDTNISPRRLMPHLLHQMVHNYTNLGGHSIQMIIKSNQAMT